MTLSNLQVRAIRAWHYNPCSSRAALGIYKATTLSLVKRGLLEIVRHTRRGPKPLRLTQAGEEAFHRAEANGDRVDAVQLTSAERANARKQLTQGAAL